MKNLRAVDTCLRCKHVLNDCEILFCNIDQSAPKPPTGEVYTQEHWDYSDAIVDWGHKRIVSDNHICDLFERKS